jgi:hypothetical protein
MGSVAGFHRGHSRSRRLGREGTTRTRCRTPGVHRRDHHTDVTRSASMRPRIFPVGKTAPASRSTNLDHPDRDAESSIDGSVILVGGLAEPAGEVVVQVLRVEFGRYFNGVDGEVLLWVPDIVAGSSAPRAALVTFNSSSRSGNCWWRSTSSSISDARPQSAKPRSRIASGVLGFTSANQ